MDFDDDDKLSKNAPPYSPESPGSPGSTLDSSYRTPANPHANNNNLPKYLHVPRYVLDIKSSQPKSHLKKNICTLHIARTGFFWSLLAL